MNIEEISKKLDEIDKRLRALEYYNYKNSLCAGFNGNQQHFWNVHNMSLDDFLKKYILNYEEKSFEDSILNDNCDNHIPSTTTYIVNKKTNKKTNIFKKYLSNLINSIG